MAKKKSKLTTPEWITQGFDSPAEYEKSQGKTIKKKKTEKTFNIRECPKCGSDDMSVALGEVGVWECRKCKYKGSDINEKELTEDEFMKYLDKKGEEVA